MKMSNPGNSIQNNQFWQNHLSQWRQTSLSQTEYCRQHNIRADSFSYHKCKTLKKTSSTKPKGFIKVPLPPQKIVEKPLTLKFNNGSCLTGISESNLTLVKQLAVILA